MHVPYSTYLILVALMPICASPSECSQKHANGPAKLSCYQLSPVEAEGIFCLPVTPSAAQNGSTCTSKLDIADFTNPRIYTNVAARHLSDRRSMPLR
ncbi:hypothetical protein V1507DRAFT_229369 [Lipomyces tetrasporus]